MMMHYPPVDDASVPVPDDLRVVPKNVLEGYVYKRLQKFAKSFASFLVPGVSNLILEAAFEQALQYDEPDSLPITDTLYVRFRHNCKYYGCTRKECALCVNNPYKRCSATDNFDDCYADNQTMRSKCEADVFLELVSLESDSRVQHHNMELQVSVIDGESYNPNANTVRELLRSDEGHFLLGTHSNDCRVANDGRLLLKLQDGFVKLPDICITDKNDTFHCEKTSFATFRLMARAVKKDSSGKVAVIRAIGPAFSEKFTVKTQRALNDYRKSEYPHYKDELTKLKFIGNITAQRFREIGQHLGPDLPCESVETVEQLCELMEYADTNRQIEAKMVEMLNMKGKHKHKWEYLKEVLYERIVYDDIMPRVWFTDDSMSRGVLFSCRQGQVNMEKPLGLVLRTAAYPPMRLQVYTHLDGNQQEAMKALRQRAEAAWNLPNHAGWVVVQDDIELIHMSGGISQQQERVPIGILQPYPLSSSQSVSPLSTPEGRLDMPAMRNLASQSSSGRLTPPAGMLPAQSPAATMPFFSPQRSRISGDFPMDYALTASPSQPMYSNPNMTTSDPGLGIPRHGHSLPSSPCPKHPGKVTVPSGMSIPKRNSKVYSSAPSPDHMSPGSSSLILPAFRRMSTEDDPYRRLRVSLPSSPSTPDHQSLSGKRQRGTASGEGGHIEGADHAQTTASSAPRQPSRSESNGRGTPRQRSSPMDPRLGETPSYMRDHVMPDDLDRILLGMPVSPSAVMLNPRSTPNNLQDTYQIPDWLEQPRRHSGSDAGVSSATVGPLQPCLSESMKQVPRYLERCDSDSFKHLMFGDLKEEVDWDLPAGAMPF